MTTYTYEELRSLLSEKGVELSSGTPDLPEWKGRTLVSLTPEQAKALIELDAKLAKEHIYRTKPTPISQLIHDNYWEPSMGDVRLRPNYKVWKGMCIVTAVSEMDHPVDVYIDVADGSCFGSTQTNATVCSRVKEAVTEIVTEEGYEMPEIADEVWETKLPAKLTDLEITSTDYMDRSIADPDPVLVAVLSRDRSVEYPDRLYIVRYGDEGEAPAYACNLIPDSLAILPGTYTDLLGPYPDSDYLIQTKPVTLGAPVMEGNTITGFDQSSYSFMRVTIPLQADDASSATPVGAVFDEETKADFLEDLVIHKIVHNVTLVVLDEDVSE